MSSWAHAMVAANSAVATPMIATVHWVAELKWTMGALRHIRYTPAVTMVAAWMRADTGVGPSMASASHGNRGIWADLPTAATNSSRQMAVTVPGDRAPTW